MKLCLIFLVFGVVFIIGETAKFKGYDKTSDDVRSFVDEPEPNNVDESEISDDVRSLLDESDDVDNIENALSENDVRDVGDGNYVVAVKDANGNVKAWWVGPALGLAKWGIRKIRWGRQRKPQKPQARGHYGRRPRKRQPGGFWDVISAPDSEDETEEEFPENSHS